jgi:hypothetical protein
MLRAARTCFFTALSGALALVACSHDGTMVEGSTVRANGISIAMGEVPPTWKRIDVDGATLAFRDQAQDAVVLLNTRCQHRDNDAPLSVLTRHLVMGTTERDVLIEETIPFDQREALHTVMRAKLDGVPRQYDIYVIKKDDCILDLVYVAPPERFSEGAPLFERFAMGVHAVSGGGP